METCTGSIFSSNMEYTLALENLKAPLKVRLHIKARGDSI